MRAGIRAYGECDYTRFCDMLAEQDERLAAILEKHGYPPFWHRPPGFDTLVRIIIEQQVSVAAGKTIYGRLKERLGEITPQTVLDNGEDVIRECGLSGRKASYARALAEAAMDGLDVDGLTELPDAEIAKQLIAVKGIGMWTVNVYLLGSLHRLDVFPGGDLALVKSMVKHGFLPEDFAKGEVEKMADAFAPYRSIFALLLWHGYVEEKGFKMPM